MDDEDADLREALADLGAPPHLTNERLEVGA
jgi:hypothetical protein